MSEGMLSMQNLKRGLIAALVAVATLTAGAVHAAPSQALGRDMIRRVTSASVQLGPVVIVTSRGGREELKVFGIGSGTLLHGGYILTNHHVTDVTPIQQQARGNKNITVVEGLLVVMLTKRTDEPPVPSYIAQVVVDRADLDLAVLRIVKDLSGNDVDPNSLKLPFLELGDSDKIELGDTLNIFGYPGIGGDTITFTSGPVSGFSSEGSIARGWVKTSATIAGGNSGGTAVDDNGRLVGIPTQGGAGNTDQIVDCRPVTDTNGDGRVNDGDTCVTIGGFINSLRPVNLARPLIEQARSGRGGGAVAPGGGQANTPAADSGVIISGRIVDAASGRPIANATFVVLKPGLDWQTAEGTDEEIYVSATTDRNGNFEIDLPLQRGETYSVGYGAKNYKPELEDGVEIGANTPDVVKVTLKLQRK
jgi:S1-C subfamily serine protease